MPTIEFCEQLFERGILLAEPWRATAVADDSVRAILQKADRLARSDAPGTAPPFDLPAAEWGLNLLAWSVCLLVDRANADTAMPRQLAESEPSGELACHHWSSDLSMRYLSDVLLRAQAAASEDAFVAELGNICSRWPLACVGTQKNWNALRGQVIIDEPSLRCILLDRIIARNDKAFAETPVLKGYIEAYAPRQSQIN